MTGRIMTGVLVVAALTLPLAGCERIPEICEASCKQQKECDPNFEEWYTIYDCRAECEDSMEDYVEDVPDECAEAYLDYYECAAELTCGELDTHDYSRCEAESLRMSESCDYYY